MKFSTCVLNLIALLLIASAVQTLDLARWPKQPSDWIRR
jgi:hypothetical protein